MPICDPAEGLPLDELMALTDYKPHPGQREFHESPARFRILACGRRWGKSLCATMEGLRLSLGPRPTLGWVVAPTFPLTQIIWRAFEAAIPKEILAKKLITDRRFELQNGSQIEFKSAHNEDSLRGAGLDWLVIDEAACVSRPAWEMALRPTLTDKLGRAIMISTPRGRNWFYELYLRGLDPNEPDFTAWKAPTRTNPHIDGDEIDEAKRTLPGSVFRQEYGADFLYNASAVFRNIEACIQGDLEEPQRFGRYVMGVDLAKYTDYTVLCVLDARRRHLVYFDRFHHQSWDLQRKKIRAVAEKYDAGVIVDSTGVGDPICEDLIRMNLSVQAFKFTSASKQKLIETLILAIEQRNITFPEIPELTRELDVFEYQIGRDGFIHYAGPSGYHDDCVIALALANYAVESSCMIPSHDF